MNQGYSLRIRLTSGLALAALALGTTAGQAKPVIQPLPVATATPGDTPESILPPVATPSVSPPPKGSVAIPGPASAGGNATVTPPVAMVPVPVVEPVMNWKLADAQALLAAIQSIDSEGLIATDYQPEALSAALAAGEGPALDDQASRSMGWLIEDLRDGRTPMPARVQWFALDPDQDTMPTTVIMAKALDTHDIAGTLAALDPTHPDYAVLKETLASTPRAERATRALIRANMDRWRWLAHDLGHQYLITNVPEFQLRLTVNNSIVRTYRTIVGKPGRTATPQLAEQVQAVVFNPTWTVPQSIVVGEGMGAKFAGNPAAALRQGYKVTKSGDGTITIVQQPGPNNSLGLMKIDMPNPHAIYLHDTPNRGLFNAPVRAFSHGCVRTERATELGMTMAILGANMTPEQGVANATSGKYTRVTMAKSFPVYITYFTMAQDITGALTKFADIYGRDAPVLASFNQPRQVKTTQRVSNEAIIKLDNPL